VSSALDEHAERIGECRCEIVFDGLERRLRIVRADPVIVVSEHVLANLDPGLAHFGDGILTLHGVDGDVSYGLTRRNPYLMQWLGVRSA
jgi:hypothetical protein